MKCVLNGKKVELQSKKTILEAARENGISIPSLCDFQRLSPFSGCRLCLVEIEGRRGFVPSCSTFVEEEMVIKTDSPQLKKLRRQILELILSEHPSSCLICSEKNHCDDKKATIRKVGETTVKSNFRLSTEISRSGKTIRFSTAITTCAFSAAVVYGCVMR